MKNSVGTTEKIKTEESEDNKMKNLKTLQTLSKMGKILSRIAFVFAMIGACGCIMGLLSVARISVRISWSRDCRTYSTAIVF